MKSNFTGNNRYVSLSESPVIYLPQKTNKNSNKQAKLTPKGIRKGTKNKAQSK